MILGLLPGNHPLYADFIRRFPARTIQWTYGCEYCTLNGAVLGQFWLLIF